MPQRCAFSGSSSSGPECHTAPLQLSPLWAARPPRPPTRIRRHKTDDVHLQPSAQIAATPCPTPRLLAANTQQALRKRTLAPGGVAVLQPPAAPRLAAGRHTKTPVAHAGKHPHRSCLRAPRAKKTSAEGSTRTENGAPRLGPPLPTLPLCAPSTPIQTPRSPRLLSRPA